MKSIVLTAKRGNAASALRLALYLLVPFLLTAVRLFSAYAPFGLAAVAAAGPKKRGALSLLGLGAGAFLFLDFQSALRTFAAGLLIFASSVAFFDTKLYTRSFFRPAVAVFWVLAVETPSLFGYRENLLPWLLCAAVCGGASLLFCAGASAEGKSRARSTALLLVGIALCAAAVPIKPGGVFSVGRVLLYALVPAGMSICPEVAGTAIGLCAGLTGDLAENGGSLFLTAALGVGSLICGFVPAQRRIFRAAALFLPVALLILLYHAQGQVPLVCEAAVGCLLYLSLPARLLAVRPLPGEKKAEEENPLAQSAEAFRELYHCFRSPKPARAPENPSVLFDRAAEQVCRKCVLCTSCWQEHYNDTYNAFNDATPKLLQRGRAVAADFPAHFSARCQHFPDFLAVLNVEIQTYLLRRQYHLRLKEAQVQAQEQFACFSEVLSDAAKEKVPVFSAALFAGYQVGSALCPKAGETECGDQLSAFSCGDTLYLLLSDGMGSGAEAHRESAMVIRLLEKFLHSGIDPSPALKTLNAALTLRSEDTGAFTTVDLLAMRQSSGEAALYKYGAAASYCKKGGHVARYTAGNLPAGLQSDPPEATRLTLAPDSFFIMVSDGVTGGSDNEWLENFLAGWEDHSPQALAKAVLTEACARRHLDDDCAALVLYLPEENRKKQV